MRNQRRRVSQKQRDTLTEQEILYIIFNKLRDINYENMCLTLKLLRTVKILHDTNCWVTNEDWSEYRTFNYEKVHRLSYRLFIGDIIKDVLHHCDRKGCMNYEHLFQGSDSNNRKDWETKKAIYLKNRQEELLKRRIRTGKIAYDACKVIRSWREMAGSKQ